MANFNIKYRTFDELMDEVLLDFKKYDLEGLIDNQDYIKVVKKINYELGLRIHQTKEEVIEISNHLGKLPEDLRIINMMLICSGGTMKQILPQGTHIEERILTPEYKLMPPDPKACSTPPIVCPPVEETYPCVQSTCKGDDFILVQKINTTTYEYRDFYKVKLKNRNSIINCDCPNLHWNSEYVAQIDKSGKYLETNFDTEKLYINYESEMVDEEGNLLVIDHDGINSYYEYKIKYHILENLIVNDENVSQAKLQLVMTQLREAKNFAHLIVKTPDFNELKQLHSVNRKAMWNRYYSMF
jgi:hypothetical protein